MKLGRFLILGAVALLSVGASKGRAPNWNAIVTVTPEGGYLVGNPRAAKKLVEFVSYTCPHCAHFESEAGAPLRQSFIASGKVAVEYRPFMRNRIDIAASLIATCGPAAKFPGNHALLLGSQGQWFQGPTRGDHIQDFKAAMQAIAADYKLYALMAPRGYTKAQLDVCLGNRAAMDKLAAQTQHAVDQVKIEGTPSFLINGQLQDVNDWNSLRSRLSAR